MRYAVHMAAVHDVFNGHEFDVLLCLCTYIISLCNFHYLSANDDINVSRDFSMYKRVLDVRKMSFRAYMHTYHDVTYLNPHNNKIIHHIWQSFTH